MSWLSNFLGLRRIKTPAVQQAEELDFDYDASAEEYLKRLAKKQGFEKTIVTGGKKPKLSAGTYLGAT